MPERNRVISKKIGELLIERGFISREQLDQALKAQAENKKLVGEILVDLGYASEEEVMICLTTQYGMPYLALESYDIDLDIIKSVPTELVKKYHFIPIDKIANLLTIVTSDILDKETLDELEKVLACKIQIFVTTPHALREAIEKYYQ